MVHGCIEVAGNPGVLAQIDHRAATGDPEAEMCLGSLYVAGLHVPRDPAQAALWIRKAAEQGYPAAEVALGGIYESGAPPAAPRDYVQAASWYRKAAEQDDGMAQLRLGLLYERGLGMPRDYAQACFWFDVADQGSPENPTVMAAVKSRERASKHLPPAELAAVQKRAERWLADYRAHSR